MLFKFTIMTSKEYELLTLAFGFGLVGFGACYSKNEFKMGLGILFVGIEINEGGGFL